MEILQKIALFIIGGYFGMRLYAKLVLIGMKSRIDDFSNVLYENDTVKVIRISGNSSDCDLAMIEYK